MYLVGDIGGTKTNLAWASPLGAGFALSEVMSLPSASMPDLGEAIAAFKAASPPAAPVLGASFGVAGPVDENRCLATNLPWRIDGPALSVSLGIPVTLLNDLEALGHGLGALQPEDLLTLNPGVERPGTKAIVAAGTGLGEALCVWDGQRHIVNPSEGGHADFAPRGPLQMGLHKSLSRIYGHVSVERVVSGLGIVEIFAYLGRRGVPTQPEVLRAVKAGAGAGPISEAAIRGGCPRSAETLALFLDAYGAEASNLALKGMARGGVYIGGGIAPKLLPLLTAGGFMAAYLDKGRFRPHVQDMPVRVILNPLAPLLGAAAVAARSVL